MSNKNEITIKLKDIDIEQLDKSSLFLHEEIHQGFDFKLSQVIPNRSMVIHRHDKRYLVTLPTILEAIIDGIDEVEVTLQ